MAIDLGEAALVVVGIDSIIKREMPIVGSTKLKEIEGLEQRIQELAQQLVDDTLPEPDLDVAADASYRKLLDRLSTKHLPPEEIQKLAAKFRDDATELIGPFTIAIQHAYDYLRSIFPIAEFSTFAGPTNLVPDTEKTWRFALQLQILRDPLQVFPLIASGALLQSQVATLKQFFPTLAQTIDNAIYQAVNKKVAEYLVAGKGAYKLPDRAEIGVGVWRGARPIDHAPKPAKKIVPTVKRPLPGPFAKSLQTPGQKAANVAP